jgi:mono/diheme cytochrome c family protein
MQIHIYSVVVLATAVVAGGAALVSPPQQGTSAGGGRMGRDNPSANALPYDRWQAKALPALPTGVTLDMIRMGDSVFHYAGACITCHGPNAMGLPDKGSSLSLGLHFVPTQIDAIDTLVTQGLPEALTRSSVAMPPRGAGSNLTPDQIRSVSAYVWAIAQVAGEPWPGGHKTHGAETKRNTGE